MFGLFRRKPPPSAVRHPELGVLEPGDGGWDARVELGGTSVVLSVEGDEQPDERAVAHACVLVREGPAFAARVHAFLLEESEKPSWRPPEASAAR